MKKQRSTLLSLFILGLLFMFPSGDLFPGEDSTYGHISYIDKGATVIRQDQTEHKAVVNLPVVPGDQIVTGEKGRCELQFDNGTVVRLDKDSRLKVTTILAPALTSKWKITTLHLMRGEVYSMNQSYNREMFQIITPNAAVDLKKRSSAAIQLDAKGNTHIFADRGKFKVMYGGEADSLKSETIRSGSGCSVTPGHKLTMEVKSDTRDIDFMGWNEYVNRNFRDLHRGISKVPKKLYRYNKAIVYWAEKWSSLVGEWVYDDLFGYVWKPADEIFRFSSRPFFHADYIKVNDQYFVVPQQPWGWAPSHLGTWVWMKGGWTWVPGNNFTGGIYSRTSNIWGFMGGFSYPGLFFPSLGYWLGSSYGGRDLYYTYRTYGEKAWREAYRKTYNKDIKRPEFNNIPKSVRELIKKMNKAPLKMVKDRLGDHRPSIAIDIKSIKPLSKSTTGTKPLISKKISKKGVASPSPVKQIKSNARKLRAALAGDRVQPRLKKAGPAMNFRDWNPDKQWARSKGYTVRYSSKSNAMICTDLKLNSRTMSTRDRVALKGNRTGTYGKSRSGGFNNDGSGSSSSGSSTGAGTSSSRTVSSRGSGRGSGFGNSSNTKDK